MKTEVLIANAFKKAIPFVLFQYPNKSSFNALINTTSNAVINGKSEQLFNKNGFVFHPAQVSSNQPIARIESDELIKIDNWDTASFNAEFDNNLFETLKPHLPDSNLSISNKKTYLKQANTLINALNNKEAEKVILSRIKLVDTTTSFNPINYFNALRTTYPNVFCYLFFLPGIGLWLGATPELLLDIDEKTVKTVALAGTQKDEGKPLSQVFWGEKEKEEQQIVTNEVVNVFNTYFKNNVEVNGPETVSTGNLLHLKSHIQSANKEANPYQLINNLHPTPAIVGHPRNKAQALINTIETHNRSYYTGYLGHINNQGNTKLFVNLRCMQVLKNKLALYVGGGLTKDSQADAEWQETEAKAETLLNLL